jgi:hypothetical protein
MIKPWKIMQIEVGSRLSTHWDIDTLMQSWRIALLKGTIDTINVNKK